MSQKLEEITFRTGISVSISILVAYLLTYLDKTLLFSPRHFCERKKSFDAFSVLEVKNGGLV